MGTQQGEYPLFKLDIRCQWVVNTMPWPLHPTRCKEGWLVWGQSKWLWKTLPSPGFEPKPCKAQQVATPTMLSQLLHTGILYGISCVQTHVFYWLAACSTQTAQNQGGTARYIPFHFGCVAAYLNPLSPSPESTGKKD